MVAGSAALLAGCAQYEARPISAVREAAALDARTLTNKRLREFLSVSEALAGREARPSWGLDSLTLAAVYYHRSLEIARAKLASAKAGVISAAQIRNPLLNIAGFYNGTVLTPSPWNAGAMINFLVEAFGKRQDRIAQADALADAARDDLATATWQVRGSVREALLDLWAARERVRLLKEQLRDQNQFVKILDERLNAGQTSSVEATLQRISRNQTALTLSAAQQQMESARAQLAAAIGIPFAALSSVKFSFVYFTKLAPNELKLSSSQLRRAALTRRSDVQASLATYAAAESGLRLAISGQFPNLSVGPGYEFDQGANKWHLSGATGLPIFNQNQGPIAQSEANRQKSAAQFIALQAQIIGAIDNAQSSYKTASETVHTADSLLTSARAHLREVSRSFSAGTVGHASLLSAQIEFVTIEVSRFDAAVKQREAIGALEDALQRPLFDAGKSPPILPHVRGIRGGGHAT